MRWLIYGRVRSGYAVDSLIAALERAGQEVAEIQGLSPTLIYEPTPETEAETRRRIEAALPADVLFNFGPTQLTPALIQDLRGRGLRTVAWLADDPLLFRVSYKHVAAAYDLTLHCGRADVLDFYEERLGVRGYSFPWWSDTAHFPYGYAPDAADIEVGFLGNCRGRRRSERYELLASLPWKTRFFGNQRKGVGDPAGIHAGYLEGDELPAGLRRFRVAVNMAQTFVGIRDEFQFPRLPHFGEYFFPSRLVVYAGIGIPTVSLTQPGLPPPFPGVVTASDRDELVARIGELIDDRDALLARSAAVRAQFEACLTAATRVAMLLRLLDGPRDHGLEARADLWRQFGDEAPEPAGAKVLAG